MSAFSVVLELPPASAGPVYLRIAHAVVDSVRRGRLRAGDRIPGSRALATELGVHRNTVKAAYAELTAQGWIRAEPSSGTFISPELPDKLPRQFVRSLGERVRGDVVGFDMQALDVPPADAWPHLAQASLVFGGMDRRLMPLTALSRAYRRALASRGGDALGYRIGRGHPRLIAALRSMLATARGIPEERSILVTRGSQMALYLVIRALFRPGDVVAIEDPGYAFSWPAFRLAGVKLVPLPTDGHGLRVDRLASLVERERVRAVLVTPHMHYPTGVTLAAARRIQLLDLARRARFAILEDDWVHEVRFEDRPILPLASADPAGVTIYLGSFSKTFAPSLRVGFVVAPEPVIERLARVRSLVDVCGDGALELAVAELLEDGEIQRHVRRTTRVYRQRRDVLATELSKRLAGVVRFDKPRGGTSLWAEVDPSIDVERWSANAIAQGVGFLTGRHFFHDERVHPNLWLGFAGLDERQLEEAVKRMEKALPKRARGRRLLP